jgi:hypothetical protein
MAFFSKLSKKWSTAESCVDVSGPWDSAKSPSINPKDFAAQESRKRLINFLCKEVEVPGYCLSGTASP